LIYYTSMALNLKNAEVERLAEEVAEMTGETKTEAIRKALLERRERLSFRVLRTDRRGDLRRFLAREVWPQVPAAERGRRLTREEEDVILGAGPEDGR
jgi:antitoxin VapB